jgi:pyruvate-formate lyase-activating enzyme
MKNVFYGYGDRSEYFANKIIARGITPDCFIDEDPAKQSVSAVYGVPVYSLKTAKELFGTDFDIYLTTERAELIASYLTQNEIKLERIKNINNKGKTCYWINNSLSLLTKGLSFCCVPGRRPPLLPYDEIIDNKYSFYMNEYHTKVVEKLNDENNCDICINCELIEECNYINTDDSYTIRNVHLAFDGVCNFDCIYCSRNGRNDKLCDTIPDVKNILSDIDLSVCDYIDVTCEEITALPTGGEILKYLESLCIPLHVFSNCSIFMQELADAIKNNVGSKIVVSVDAGTKETFAQIKQRDVYEKVVDNIKKYSRFGNVSLKYILLPDINDDEINIEGFTELCETLKPYEVFISRNTNDYLKNNPLPQKTIEAGKRLYKNLLKIGITAIKFGYFHPTEDEKIFKSEAEELIQYV